MNLLVDVFQDSLLDTLKLIPFLLVTYLAMEALEHTASHHVQAAVERSGSAGPIVGSLLGALPQCGFSAMASTLYAGRVVTAGTLVAVILSTSDEMIPVFVAHQVPVSRIFVILGFKVVVGIVVGLLTDLFLRARHRAGDGHMHIQELCDREESRFDHSHNHGHHHHHHGEGIVGIFSSALFHTIQVAAFIFVVTLVFGLIIEGVGQDAIADLFARNPIVSTFIAGLVGLIPNCGASVVVAELFLDGTLSSGQMLAGLLTSGGVGLLVLWRTNNNVRQNASITALTYLAGVVVGLVVQAMGIMF